MLSLLILASTAMADPVSDYAGQRVQCWSRTDYQSTTTIDDSGNIKTQGGDKLVWGVKDSKGMPLDTETFATMVGDDAYLEELRVEAKRASKKNFPLIVGGGAVAGLGGLGLVLGRSGDGSAALLTGGSVLLSGGGVLAGLGVMYTRVGNEPLKTVTAAYDRGLANQRCEAYNDKLRAELGLTRDQTRAIDTASLYRVPPKTRIVRFAPSIGPGTFGLAGTF